MIDELNREVRYIVQCSMLLLDGTHGALSEPQREAVEIIFNQAPHMVANLRTLIDKPSKTVAESQLHDLNSALSLVLGYAGMLWSGYVGPLNSQQQIVIQRILNLAGDVYQRVLQTYDLKPVRWTSPKYRRLL